MALDTGVLLNIDPTCAILGVSKRSGGNGSGNALETPLCDSHCE